jgi:transposase
MKRVWSWQDVLPSGASLTVRSVSVTDDALLVEAEGQAAADCPSCGRRSQARHSRYWRTLKDVAAHGQAVTLRVQVSRWRCRKPGLWARDFRGTTRQCLRSARAPHDEVRRRRTSRRLCVGRLRREAPLEPTAHMILRLVKRGASAAIIDEPVHVIGIDDWAWQKGQHHYGTILVDLERRRVVDLLPTRAAGSVATWLAARPSIRMISRDRHGPYAEGIHRGAPHAHEVADRFHLVSNLRGAVQQVSTCT